MKILDLVLKKQWFDMIKDGEIDVFRKNSYREL